MIGRIAARTVDAFGVDAEPTAGVDEHQHRRIAVVQRREVVHCAGRVARAHPVRWRIELRTDHHQHGQPWWRITGEPYRRQVHEFAAVLEFRGCSADGHRHHGAVGGAYTL